MKILITGGCGYKGSVLVPRLLGLGYKVIVHDTHWFGSYLKPHKNLELFKTDIRDTEKINFDQVNAFIHLANVANDPAVELNPTSSWEINVLASQQLVDKAIRQNVEHIIFASSGSVYGVKEEPKVTEELPLVPISTYNKTKMVAERVFLSYSNQAKIHCVRPAKVCGLSPRMRLDVAVNLLTFQAISNQKIRVLGGSQVRPNIHIDDIANLYIHLLINKDNIDSGCYNAGFENISIIDIAQKIKNQTQCEINIEPSNDPRSYRQDSSKIINTGFKPKKTVNDAITEIISSYKNGFLKDIPEWHTVKWMKTNNFS